MILLLDAWGRSDVKVLLRSDQEVTLILREVQARDHGSHGMLRTKKHAIETRGGGRLETDHHFISWMLRHFCRIFRRYHVRADGRTPVEVLRNNSYRGGLACFGEVVWARVPGTTLLRGKFEVNWLELVSVGKTENTEEHLCGDEHGVRKFRTIRRQPDSARWRSEFVDKLTGDPFNPKPKRATVIGSSLATCQLTCNGASEPAPNVNVDEAPGDEVPEPEATQKRCGS